MLPPSEARYGYCPKGHGTWKPSVATHKAAKLFVSREWVESLERTDENAGEPHQETAAPSDDRVLQDSPTVNADDGTEADSDADLDDAPPLVILDDAQKFRDAAGNIVEIEMRGERTVDGVFFYARDVATKMLQQVPDRLAKNRSDTNRNGNDEEEDQYKCFRRNERRAVFLSYLGLVRAFFASRSPFAANFCQQAVRNPLYRASRQRSREKAAGQGPWPR
ncbi:hypothetical protein HDU87_007206 [Geranomyces variabilis]|uniref:Uncharacterized protein n=1 Tax=Geranomyces variabilis TaxID=109894 RepID=A0AAD5TGK1_9FUNG|nr:hypothetical protein HDU87_007206 [Geranomyces variabilis]